MKVVPFIYLLFSALILVTLGCVQLAVQSNVEGNNAFASQNYEAALKAYKRAEDRAPNLAEPSYNLGNTHYVRREYGSAVERYQQALLNADEGLTKSGLFNLGNAYFNDRNFDGAVESYREVLRLDPNDEDARHNLELAMRQLAGESSEADTEQQTSQQQENQSQNPDQQDQQSQNESPNVQNNPNDQQSEEGERGQDSENDQTGESEVPELTEEQAKQLLESIGQSTETLQGRLHQVFVVSGESPTQDW